jgi:hypothetical protein
VWIEDLGLLACPRTRSALELADIRRRADDGEILEATLRAQAGLVSNHRWYPALLPEHGLQRELGLQVTVLDAGAGHNYRIIDKRDPAYEIHDLFDRNGYGGRAHRRALEGSRSISAAESASTGFGSRARATAARLA